MIKGQDQEAEQDLKRAVELDATLKPTIEKEVSNIKELHRKP
jgi:hypothetical protein